MIREVVVKPILALFLIIPMCGMCQVGKDFWIGFMANNNAMPVTKIMVSAKSSTSGTISIDGQQWTQNFTVAENSTTTIIVPIIPATGSGVIDSTKTVHVTSDDSISVYAINEYQYTSDGNWVLPSHYLGSEYYVMSYPGFSGALPSELLIVATEDNTVLEITTKCNTNISSPGVPFTLMLNKGDSYQLQAAMREDLTGTSVKSVSGCKPFALFAGAECAFVPVSTQACDHLVEQMYPVSTWSKKFLVSPMAEFNGYTVRILAAENNTEISVNGSVTNLNSGEFYELNGQTSALVILSSRPVMVMQFQEGIITSGQGDPSMQTINGQEMKTTYAQVSPLGYDVERILLVIESDDTLSVTINNKEVKGFKPFEGNAQYSSLETPLVQNTIIESDSGFTGIVYGHSWSVSYGYSLHGALKTGNYDIEYAETVCQGEVVEFVALGNSTIWSWEFEGNNISGSSTATYTFQSPGNHTFNLCVASSSSCSDTISKSIFVVEPDDAGFHYSDTVFSNSGVTYSPLITGSTGGVFSADAGLVIDPQSGEINLSSTMPGVYNVYYTTSGNCPKSSSKRITIEEGITVIPNAFSPNGDGLNDVFFPVLHGVTEYSVSVYNRWGNMVSSFSHLDEGWRGEECASGVYAYQVELKKASGKKEVLRGHITLLK